ncbi:MAG: alpha/beta hydrolase [Eubacteriales bacterium]
MNKIIRSALAAMSKHDIDLKNNYEQTRQFQHATRPYIKKITCNCMERILHLEGRDLLLRAFSHTGHVEPILIFFHGGGFVTGDFDSYSNVCASLSQQLGRKVLAVDYRLAPEHKFPAGPEDCYAATQEILKHCEDWYQADPAEAILIGDSAGATLSCVVSMMARDRGGWMPKKQILIYPAAWCDFTDATPFRSVIDNGKDYLLTQKELLDYMELYASKPEDFDHPYFAPLKHTDFTCLPETLVVTMEYDPLRDEGEALAKKLAENGCRVTAHRIKNGIHGLIVLPPSAPLTREIYRSIHEFITDTDYVENKRSKVETP